MKTIKSYLFGFAALAALTVGFTACQDNIDAPEVVVPHAKVQPNMTILELKEMFWDEATNYAKVIEDTADPERRFIIHGRVVSSDQEGNVFKSLIIQDETAALAFSIDAYNLYLDYRVGQDIVLDVTGMEIGKYAGLQQIGRRSWYENGNSWQVSFMSLEHFQNYAQLDGMPSRVEVDTLEMTSFAALSQQTPEVLRKYQSRIVRFKNVYFADGGKRTFSVYHTSENDDQNTTLMDRSGTGLTVRTSGYCTFFNEVLPVGNIDLVGILSYYNTSWQIIMIDIDGVIKVGEQPGTKEKPYTVEQAIKEQADGSAAAGWVKGYIVGAVAPEVSEVKSNDDIEWSAPTILDNTLVIAPTPDTKNYNECLVIGLTGGSVFQQVGNLSDNPGNLGKEILVSGTLATAYGTYGITENKGTASEFEIEGIELENGEIPEGDGSEATPYNVAQVVAKNPQSTTEALESGVWVKGYIVGSIPTGGSTTVISGMVFGTADAATTNVVIAPTPDCTDYNKCVSLQLPTGTIRTALNLSANPGNLGKAVAVKGDLMKYCGGPGVKNLTDHKLDASGGSDTPVTPPVTDGGDVPQGSGTSESPYNVAQIIALNPQSTTDAVQSGVWAKGYIVGSIPTGGSSTTITNTNFSTADAATTNLVLGPTANCTDPNQCIAIQLPNNAVRTALNLSANPGNLGKELTIKGDVMKYCGAAGLKNCSDYVLGEGGSQGGTDTPVTPSGNTYGKTTSVASGSAYVFVASGKYGTLFNKNYGYLSASDIPGGVADSFQGDASAALTFTAVNGGYNITTSEGRYLGAKSDYNTFDTTDDSASNRVWTVQFNADGTATITNAGTGKIVCQDPAYGSFGCYDASAASSYVLPYLYVLGEGGSTGGGGTVTPEPTPSDIPEGNGAEATPYNVDQVAAMNATSTSEAVASGIWVRGYIVGSISGSDIKGTVFSADGAAATNIVLAPYSNCTDYSKCISVQLPSGSARTALNLSANPGNLGKAVSVKGDVMKYMNCTGVKNVKEYAF